MIVMTVRRQSAHRRLRCFHATVIAFSLMFINGFCHADEPSAGQAVYVAKCASCHGQHGEGVNDKYPNPLTGDRSIGELTEYISRTMPEDKPGTCVGEEARLVSQYIHDAFYSVTAQARNKPARIELSRLTVRQYRNAIADLMSHFRPAGRENSAAGLFAYYVNSRQFHGVTPAFTRVDSIVDFDFKDQSPNEEWLDKYEFAIKWDGAIYAPDTGEYDFTLHTNQSAQLWINDLVEPLIDIYVKSDNETEYHGSMNLIGGRRYVMRLQLSKAKQGVRDRAVKTRPSEPTFISLQWKRPGRIKEIVPSYCLSQSLPAEACVLTTPFPPDDRSLGWEKATSISTEWDQASTDAAIEIMTYVKNRLENLTGAVRGKEDFVPKLKQFCSRFAEYAFRRPLDDELRNRYIERPFATGVDPEVAVQRCLLLILKSPRFLYREVGGPSTTSNDPYNVASRISFGMWDSSPDDNLMKAAADGKLATVEDVRAQAQRMLSDERATSKVREFLMRWMKVEQVPDLGKDSVRYPEFSPEIAHDLRSSLELMIHDFLSSDTANYQDLLLGDQLYMNGRLAKFYGVDLPANGDFQKVSFEPQERAGVLSHPYLMSDFAYTSTSSPIHRGVFIARSVLGRSLRSPPEAVTPLAPSLQPDLTTRERVALQTKPESCQSCHSLINSLGFSLEHFDAVGRFRKEENGHPVVSTGSYRTREGNTVEFRGVRDLAQFLASSPETHAAFVEQFFHAMIKQPIRAYGPDTKEKLLAKFTESNFNVRQLLVEIVVVSALTADNVSRQTEPVGSP